MKVRKKFLVVVMIAAALISLTVVAVSHAWGPEVDPPCHPQIRIPAVPG